MQNDNLMIKIEAKNPDVARKLERVVRSLEGVQVHPPGATDGASLLILELGEEAEQEFRYVESLLSGNAVEEVFLTCHQASPEILMQAIRTGAKEFLSQPLVDEDVRKALLRCKARRNGMSYKAPAKVGEIINVIGSKGGVGTTTVAVNLAVNLAQRESVSSVALIDMNLLFGEIPIFLEMKPKYHWGEIARQVYRLDSDFLMNILSKHSSGVHVLPSPAYYHYDQDEIPKIIERVLQLARNMFDVVIIDGGHSLGRISSKTLEMSDRVLLVSTMSLPCLSNTNKLLESFRTLGYPRREVIKIVVNRYEKNSEISMKDAEESVHSDIFWTLPNSYKTTMAAINQGKPLHQIAPNASITKSLKKLADTLMGAEEVAEKRPWWSLRSRNSSNAASDHPTKDKVNRRVA
jgi:pilus assembly protein CpaE